MWAGDDLYNLVAGNVENLGNFLKGFSGKYFRVSGDGESKDSKTILQGYKSILTSKITEDSLNFPSSPGFEEEFEPHVSCFLQNFSRKLRSVEDGRVFAISN